MNEFKIKTGLLLGPSPTQPVVSIQDTSISITTDASSLLVTGKAVYDFVTAYGGGGSSYWTLDGSTLIPIDSTVDVKLGGINIDIDAGAITLVDMDVSSAVASTVESYSFNIDGSTVAKAWSESGGGGILQSMGWVVETAQYMGDPNTNGSWRFYPDSNGDLVFEKRITGTWTEKGKFTE